MNTHQKIAFWSMFAGFCVTATAIMYAQGVFAMTEPLGSAVILTIVYLLVAWLIRGYVIANPDKIDSWFL